jgi:phospholipid-binding lipoprotein MlaA
MPGFATLVTSPPLLSAALAAAAPAAPAEPAQLPAVAPLVWTLAAAQDTTSPAGPAAPAQENAPPTNEIVVEGDYGPPEGDPAEAINLESYRITQAVDGALVEPIAYAYRDGLPEPIRDGLGNVIKNLGEPSNALNFLLQGKVGKAFETLGRLAINSTLGVGGLIDVAAAPGIGLPYRRNGFANTMGYYGIGPGPYLYLPVTGATTVRDLVGNTLDQALLPFVVGEPFNRPAFAVSYFVVNSLELRLEFDEELAAIEDAVDPYAMRRDTYLAKRRRDIAQLKGEEISEEDRLLLEELKRDMTGQSEPPLEDKAPAETPASLSHLSLAERIQISAAAGPEVR